MSVRVFVVLVSDHFVDVSLDDFRAEHFFESHLLRVHPYHVLSRVHFAFHLFRSEAYASRLLIVEDSHRDHDVSEDHVHQVVYYPRFRHGREKVFDDLLGYVGSSGKYRKFQNERLVVEEFLDDSSIRLEAYRFPFLRVEQLVIVFVDNAEHAFRNPVGFVVEKFRLRPPYPVVGNHRTEKAFDVVVLFFGRKLVSDVGKRFHVRVLEIDSSILLGFSYVVEDRYLRSASFDYLHPKELGYELQRFEIRLRVERLQSRVRGRVAVVEKEFHLVDYELRTHVDLEKFVTDFKSHVPEAVVVHLFDFPFVRDHDLGLHGLEVR